MGNEQLLQKIVGGSMTHLNVLGKFWKNTKKILHIPKKLPDPTRILRNMNIILVRSEVSSEHSTRENLRQHP